VGLMAAGGLVSVEAFGSKYPGSSGPTERNPLFASVQIGLTTTNILETH